MGPEAHREALVRDRRLILAQWLKPYGKALLDYLLETIDL